MTEMSSANVSAMTSWHRVGQRLGAEIAAEHDVAALHVGADIVEAGLLEQRPGAPASGSGFSSRG